jgi:hypothetical protein
MAVYNHLITAPYTPQGGTEKSAVQTIDWAMLFIDSGLVQ